MKLALLITGYWDSILRNLRRPVSHNGYVPASPRFRGPRFPPRKPVGKVPLV